MVRADVMNEISRAPHCVAQPERFLLAARTAKIGGRDAFGRFTAACPARSKRRKRSSGTANAAVRKPV